MYRVAVFLAAIFISASALADVPTVTANDVPPLQPLNSCQHADGTVTYQRDPCGPDTTPVSGKVEISPDGTSRHLPLDGNDAPPPPSQAATNSPAPQTQASKDATMAESRRHLGLLFGFGIIVGLVGKLLGRSFLFWFFMGLILRVVLVAAGVMQF